MDKFSQLRTKLFDNESQGNTNDYLYVQKKATFYIYFFLGGGGMMISKISFHQNSGSAVHKTTELYNTHQFAQCQEFHKIPKTLAYKKYQTLIQCNELHYISGFHSTVLFHEIFFEIESRWQIKIFAIKNLHIHSKLSFVNAISPETHSNVNLRCTRG